MLRHEGPPTLGKEVALDESKDGGNDIQVRVNHETPIHVQRGKQTGGCLISNREPPGWTSGPAKGEVSA